MPWMTWRAIICHLPYTQGALGTPPPHVYTNTGIRRIFQVWLLLTLVY